MERKAAAAAKSAGKREAKKAEAVKRGFESVVAMERADKAAAEQADVERRARLEAQRAQESANIAAGIIYQDCDARGIGPRDIVTEETVTLTNFSGTRSQTVSRAAFDALTGNNKERRDAAWNLPAIQNQAVA